jgi:hypothetical protein
MWCLIFLILHGESKEFQQEKHVSEDIIGVFELTPSHYQPSFRDDLALILQLRRQNSAVQRWSSLRRT